MQAETSTRKMVEEQARHSHGPMSRRSFLGMRIDRYIYDLSAVGTLSSEGLGNVAAQEQTSLFMLIRKQRELRLRSLEGKLVNPDRQLLTVAGKRVERSEAEGL